MSKMLKHVGKIKSTDQRCVVVFMQLPDEPNKALIINVEALPPRYEQMVMEVTNSPEGQEAKDLGNTMGRRMVPETGRTVLEELHQRGMMRAESVDNIVMLPRPNTPFELRAILEAMDGAVTPETNTEDQVKYNPVTSNQNASSNEDRLNMARNMLMEAQMLQTEAHKKFEAAYKYAPELRPAAAVDTPISQDTEVLTEKRGPGRPRKSAN